MKDSNKIGLLSIHINQILSIIACDIHCLGAILFLGFSEYLNFLQGKGVAEMRFGKKLIQLKQVTMKGLSSSLSFLLL